MMQKSVTSTVRYHHQKKINSTAGEEEGGGGGKREALSSPRKITAGFLQMPAKHRRILRQKVLPNLPATPRRSSIFPLGGLESFQIQFIAVHALQFCHGLQVGVLQLLQLQVILFIRSAHLGKVRRLAAGSSQGAGLLSVRIRIQVQPTLEEKFIVFQLSEERETRFLMLLFPRPI